MPTKKKPAVPLDLVVHEQRVEYEMPSGTVLPAVGQFIPRRDDTFKMNMQFFRVWDVTVAVGPRKPKALGGGKYQTGTVTQITIRLASYVDPREMRHQAHRAVEPPRPSQAALSS